MNPLASTKYARRLLMALAAISGILLAVGCGSSSPTAVPPPSGGFSDSNLKGTYVLSISGTDVNVSAGTESFFAIVGTITADGNGNITGGTVDINDPDIATTSVPSGVFTGQTVSASTYSITSDGRGNGTLVVTGVKTFGLDFVLTSNGHGLITRFDNAGSGSGTLDLQGSASQSSLQSLAFSLSGVDYNSSSAENPLPLLGTVGAFTLNSSGIVTSGIQDFNDNGSSAVSGLTGLPLTAGSVVLNSAGTSGKALLTNSSTSFGSLGFDVWVIDSTHLKFIETDTATSGLALSGDAFTQQTSFTAGQLVFTVGGDDSSGYPFAAGGYVTTDVNGTLANGIEDYNDNGNAVPGRTFTGTCNATAPFTAGRCQLDMTGFYGVFSFAAYPSSGGVLLLENDSNSLAIAQGAAYAQTATSFAASEGYGLNLSGANSNGEVDDIAQFNATSATSNNMTGILDENDLAYALHSDVGFTGTYTPDPTVDGRGSILVPTTGSIGTLIGGLTLEYYAVDSSTILFIEVDQGQIAMGTFELQSASSSQAAAQSRISMVRPAVRPHGALRRK